MEKRSNNKLLVTNIQRFSLHDGPGIRTTVFLKGCALHCPWCSNPENISHQIEPYYKDGKYGAYGQWYDSDELYTQLVKDVGFFCARPCGRDTFQSDFSVTSSEQLDKLPGGVTFSGGEPLLQIEPMRPLLKRLHDAHIHLAAETCLFVPEAALQIAIEEIDLFYVDLKILDAERCQKVLSGSLEQFAKNLSALLQSGRPVVFRVPVIAGSEQEQNGTADPDNRKRVIQTITDGCRQGNVIKVELIKEHNLGMSKYRALQEAGVDIRIPAYHGVSDPQMEEYQREILEQMALDCSLQTKQIPVEICKI